MQIVRCNDCGWIGREESLDQLVTDALDEEGNPVDYDQCPECGSVMNIVDVDYECEFDLNELRFLWEQFDDIPITDADEIDEEFMGWPVGTNRFDIWHWFDERYDGGVHALIEDVDA